MALPKLLQKLFTNGGAGDKLNQDIIPDIPYSKVTDAPSVDSALSSTSENPVQNKVINSALNGKLSTSGGTMTGDIIFSSSATKVASDKNTGGKVEVSQTGAALLSNQDNYEGGATLLLRSSTYPNDQRGYFYLISALSASQRYNLIGRPDGSLTWGGHKVLTVVAESYSANSWYRKYSDGWIEQGGYSTGGIYTSPATLTFPMAFSSVQYTIVGTGCQDNVEHHSINIHFKNRTTTSVKVVSAVNGGVDESRNFMWFACGK